MKEIIQNLQNKRPLVHCITNKVTMNDCANAILAVNGSPIMADDEKEVEDITTGCASLVINLGTLSQNTIPSMIKATRKANQLQHPVVLDPVGVGASRLRQEVAFALLEEHIDVIKGNASEIKMMKDHVGLSQGVDVHENDQITEDNIDEYIQDIQKFCQKMDTIVVVTGKIDLVVGKEGAYVIRNGCAQMSRITGTGCMLGSIIGAFVGANKEHMLKATALAVALMGYSGEQAYQKILEEKKGLGSMHMYLIDYLSMCEKSLKKGGLKIEKR